MWAYAFVCVFVFICSTYTRMLKKLVIHVQNNCFSTVYLEKQRVEKPLLIIFRHDAVLCGPVVVLHSLCLWNKCRHESGRWKKVKFSLFLIKLLAM